MANICMGANLTVQQTDGAFCGRVGAKSAMYDVWLRRKNEETFGLLNQNEKFGK